jgi:hypothetical protein
MVRAALILLLTALPAPALTLAELAGAWRGEGVWRVEGEPEQRLRCQMRGTLRAGGVLLTGRCATAQGGQSFAWSLRAEAGVVTAQDESPRTDDRPAPAPVEGRIDAAGLRFDTARGGHFELTRDSGGLRLLLTGQDRGRRVQGEARLRPGG